VREEQLHALHEYETSPEFDARERTAIALAVALTETPADVSDVLRKDLDAHFSRAEQVELASSIAWENYRARFNRAFDVKPAGFSTASFCVLPERREPVPEPPQR